MKYRHYVPGTWYEATSVEDMQGFYLSRLDAIRAAAKEHGYAIAVHGSTRRDLDLMAMQWRAEASEKNVLARALAHAACGISRDADTDYDWEQKPGHRVATSIPIMMCDHKCKDFDNMISAGHIDLSLVDAPQLKVWQSAMPESNGKSNFTAILCRVDSKSGRPITHEGHTIMVSEYPDRVAYEADRVRHIIGERQDRPDLLAYDDQKHSGYKLSGKRLEFYEDRERERLNEVLAPVVEKHDISLAAQLDITIALVKATQFKY